MMVLIMHAFLLLTISPNPHTLSNNTLLSRYPDLQPHDCHRCAFLQLLLDGCVVTDISDTKDSIVVTSIRSTII